MLANELVVSRTWWNGPSFLYSNEFDKPDSSTEFNTNLELKSQNIGLRINLVSKEDEPFIEFICTRFSTLQRIIYVIARCRRFVNNLKLRVAKMKILTGAITLTELRESKECLVKLSQGSTFPLELKAI